MTGLLLDTDLDTEQREYAEMVRSSGENLSPSSTTSSTSRGRRKANIEAIDRLSAVEESVDLFAERAYGKRLEPEL